jgi:hypothetical protein
MKKDSTYDLLGIGEQATGQIRGGGCRQSFV